MIDVERFGDLKKQQVFLDPGRKLVDEVVDWLCGSDAYQSHARNDNGARSLAHVMVVVPTAQSGRNLRLALAKRAAANGWGGILPPRVVLPMKLVVPAERKFVDASESEIAILFQQYVKANRTSLLKLDQLFLPEDYDDLTARFALLDQMSDIWRVLAGRGLLMRDVVGLAGEALDRELGEERRRWEQLAELERGFFDCLHGYGLAHPVESVQAAKNRAAIVGDEISEIVLPALADPLRVFEDVMRQQVEHGKRVTVLLHVAASEADRFNEWGRPLTEAWTGDCRPDLTSLTDSNIITTANGDALADAVASDFPPSDGTGALPTLALCDGELFENLAGAFMKRGYVVHNPERHSLVRSSLGRLIETLMSAYAEDALRWRTFTALFRSDDVMAAMNLHGRDRARVLEGLDLVQNAFIPLVVPKGFAFPAVDDAGDARQRRNRKLMDEFAARGREFVAVMDRRREDASLADFIRAMLQWIFAGRPIGSGAEEKEFLAATDAARDFLDVFDGETIRSLELSPCEFAAFVRRELGAAVYSLEPDSADAIRTEGWLELAWSLADRVSLAGFHEGKVPDSVVGHPFLPDGLRRELGLCSNQDRLARDSWLLSELFAAHASADVRIYVARANDGGDICRPSRLLYLCSDAALASRVERLFGDAPVAPRDRSRRVEWALRLPDAVETADHLSPSALDTYIRCPFTYLLKYGLGMQAYRDKDELGADDFGTLAHAALESYAHTQIVRGDDQLTDAVAIEALFRSQIFPDLRARYGRTTLNISLQLEALEGRLGNFATVQAEWARQGWRIRTAELEIGDGKSEDPEKKYVDPGLGFKVHGFVDRVDENVNPDAKRRFCVIDYKTWDKKSLVSHVYTSDRGNVLAHLDFGRRFGYPTFKIGKSKTERRILSVQLPVYAACLSKVWKGFSPLDSELSYLILGKEFGATGFEKLSEETISAALETARRAAECIRANVFWPPGPSGDWKWDFAGLFVTDPQTDLQDGDWAKRQKAKLGGEEVCHA